VLISSQIFYFSFQSSLPFFKPFSELCAPSPSNRRLPPARLGVALNEGDSLMVGFGTFVFPDPPFCIPSFATRRSKNLIFSALNGQPFPTRKGLGCRFFFCFLGSSQFFLLQVPQRVRSSFESYVLLCARSYVNFRFIVLDEHFAWSPFFIRCFSFIGTNRSIPREWLAAGFSA